MRKDYGEVLKMETDYKAQAEQDFCNAEHYKKVAERMVERGYGSGAYDFLHLASKFYTKEARNFELAQSYFKRDDELTERYRINSENCKEKARLTDILANENRQRYD